MHRTQLICFHLENVTETHRAFLETNFARNQKGRARKQGISKRDLFEKVKNEIQAQV